MLSGMVSCKAYTPVTSRTSVPAHSGQASVYKPLDNYIVKYKDLAISEMHRTGVPASITLAQGMIESDYGRSYLAREANNHFGIKCHSSWKGPVSRYHDNKANECFRKYQSVAESFHDHSEFLRNGSRYQFLFDYQPTDYKSWAKGLVRAGYATNPDYANLLIKKIEENNLSEYDRVNKIARQESPKTAPVAKKVVISDNAGVENGVGQVNAVLARAPRLMENNRIQYIIVKDGDTRESLEKEFNLLKWELSKYNELENNFSLSPGQILYLQPKRDKAEPGKEQHKVVNGDTMYLISQKYGIKLKTLYELNRMDPGTEPSSGSIIWLRAKKPVN